jgi:hypothetical protein
LWLYDFTCFCVFDFVVAKTRVIGDSSFSSSIPISVPQLPLVVVSNNLSFVQGFKVFWVMHLSMSLSVLFGLKDFGTIKLLPIIGTSGLYFINGPLGVISLCGPKEQLSCGGYFRVF